MRVPALFFPAPCGLVADRLNKVILEAPGKRKHLPQVFVNQLFEDKLADVMRGTRSGVALVVRANEEVLIRCKVIRCAVVELFTAIGAVHQP